MGSLLFIAVFVILIGGAVVLKAQADMNEHRMRVIAADDEDLGPAVLDRVPTLKELQTSPSEVETLRNKIYLVGFIANADVFERRNKEIYVQEVYIVDVSGRTHTIARSKDSESTYLEERSMSLAAELDVEFVRG